MLLPSGHTGLVECNEVRNRYLLVYGYPLRTSTPSAQLKKKWRTLFAFVFIFFLSVTQWYGFFVFL